MTPCPRRFHVETLGCPKNTVDSEKVVASLLADGLVPAERASDADLLVVNTCAFIEVAREESIGVLLGLSGDRKEGAKLVATGCMAERYGDELAAAMPEADAVVGFSGEGSLSQVMLRRAPDGVRDLLELARPDPTAPWAYLKIAEGCDRECAFCAIPSFRGRQRSRAPEAIEAEARSLVERGVVEIVLVAQDLASYGRDAGESGALASLLRRLDTLSRDGLLRLRLLYLYPSEVRGALLDSMLGLETVVPYFDLSLQHASGQLLRRMRRWGSGETFLALVDGIRSVRGDAAFRSSFISGFPGETETDHEEMLGFLRSARLDWAGFFPYSREDGTVAAALDGEVPPGVVAERLRELSEVQDPITAALRDALVGELVEVLVDGPGDSEGGDRLGGRVGRTHREAPEIDGVVHLGGAAPGAGTLVTARVTSASGPDLEAVVVEPCGAERRAG
ncbi:MAG: 30S ribosomal protein S12 methylthiotransferase RimO [Acidimicrobiia bacterium]|nr:30S ribosomal protein S12 methylthiotransferase RimO [Acidimicrobiia bacterium]